MDEIKVFECLILLEETLRIICLSFISNPIPSPSQKEGNLNLFLWKEFNIG